MLSPRPPCCHLQKEALSPRLLPMRPQGHIPRLHSFCIRPSKALQRGLFRPAGPFCRRQKSPGISRKREIPVQSGQRPFARRGGREGAFLPKKTGPEKSPQRAIPKTQGGMTCHAALQGTGFHCQMALTLRVSSCADRRCATFRSCSAGR